MTSVWHQGSMPTLTQFPLRVTLCFLCIYVLRTVSQFTHSTPLLKVLQYNDQKSNKNLVDTVSKKDRVTLETLMSSSQCERRVNVLESVHAIAHTGVCFNRQQALFRDASLDAKCESEANIQSQTHQNIYSKGNLLNITRFSCMPIGNTPGIVTTSSSCVYKQCRVPLHKYTVPLTKAKPSLAKEIFPQLAVYLNELHANKNIGHASRDTLFLSHVLRHFVVDDVLIVDRTTRWRAPNEHRKRTVGAIAAFVSPRTRIHWSFHKDNVTICPKVVLEKAITFPGDILARSMIRNAVYDECSISRNLIPTEILIERHHKTRQWSQHTELHLFKSLKQRPWAHGRKIRIMSFHDISYCDQIKALARSKVAVAHHGAFVQGNGIFLRDGSIMVEIVRQYDIKENNTFEFAPLFRPTDVTGFSAAVGISSLSANVAFAASRRLDYYMVNAPVSIKESRWDTVLERLDGWFSRVDMV